MGGSGRPSSHTPHATRAAVPLFAIRYPGHPVAALAAFRLPLAAAGMSGLGVCAMCNVCV
jgi:hypothetical protein